MKRLPMVTLGLLLLAMLAVSSCTTAEPAATSNMVYISDFDLEVAPGQQPGPGSFPKPVPLSQRLGYGRPRLEPTPEQRARDLVDLMSRSLLGHLRQAGIPAQRLAPGAPLPPSGWLVRGAFFDLDAGGRLRRAVAFGPDSTQEVLAAIDQLGAAPPRPLYTIVTTAPSGRFPNAIVRPNPNIALGRFVLTPGELDRNVTGAAEEIADQLKMRTDVGASQTSETK